MNIDLKDFFGSISRRRVFGVLCAIGLDEEVAEAVCDLATTRNRLPQGAPTSPLLANMVSYRLDIELMQLAATNKLRYTRYADDISLSSFAQPHALFEGSVPLYGKVSEERLSSTLRAAIRRNGFEINPEKIWFSTTRSRKEVTGLVVNEFTNVRRGFVRDLRASLFKIESLGMAAAQSDYCERYGATASLESVVRGRLEWIAQVRGRSFGPYRTLGRRFNSLFPLRPVPIEPTYEELAEGAVWVIEYLVGTECIQGTAFFLRDVGLVTADHVLAKLPSGAKAEIYRPHLPTRRYEADHSSRRCAHRDLAILNHNVPEAEQMHLPATSSDRRVKDSVIALGFPSFAPGSTLGQSPGHIVGFATQHGVPLIEVSTVLGDGASGGPIVNDRYQVVAIAKRGGLMEPKQLAVDVAEVLKLASE